jgi:hypothetical protein
MGLGGGSGTRKATTALPPILLIKSAKVEIVANFVRAPTYRLPKKKEGQDIASNLLKILVAEGGLEPPTRGL